MLPTNYSNSDSTTTQRCAGRHRRCCDSTTAQSSSRAITDVRRDAITRVLQRRKSRRCAQGAMKDVGMVEVSGAEGLGGGRRRRGDGRGGELREEACVNDFGRFVHTGDVHCKDPFTKGELNPPATMTSLPVIVDNDRFSSCASFPCAFLSLLLFFFSRASNARLLLPLPLVLHLVFFSISSFLFFLFFPLSFSLSLSYSYSLFSFSLFSLFHVLVAR